MESVHSHPLNRLIIDYKLWFKKKLNIFSHFYVRIGYQFVSSQLRFENSKKPEIIIAMSSYNS